MNDPSLNPSSEQELESRITAVVLGEASDFERDQIDRLIEQRPDLAEMKARFESAHQLLRDVGQEEWPAEDDGQWKLPGERRQALLDVLSGDSGNSRLAAAPEGSRSAGKFSRFTKIGALVCAACLLLTLGVWQLATPRQMAMVRSAVQSAPEASGDASADHEEYESLAAAAPEAAGGTISSSDLGRYDMSGGMGGGMDGVGNDSTPANQPVERAPSFAAPSGRSDSVQLQLPSDEPIVGFEQKMLQRSRSVELSMGESLQDSLPQSPSPQAFSPPPAPALPPAQEPQDANEFQDFDMKEEDAGRASVRSGAAMPGLEVDANTTKALADRSPSASSAPAMENMRSNRQFSQDDKAPLAKDAPLAAAASEPQSRAIEQGERSLDFGKSSAREKLRLSRSQLLQTTESESASEMKVKKAESKSRPYDEVQGDALDIIAGVKVTQSNGEPNADLSADFYARDADLPQLQSQPAQKEWELDQLSRSSGQRDEKQSPVAFVPESNAAIEPFSTFSLHVSDVSFKLAAAALAQGQWPQTDKIRIEEFVNALDYGDPLPRQHEAVAGQIEQCIDPFMQQRNLLRVSLRTAAAGRASTTPLRLTLLLDNSGSMERIDRQETVRRAFETLTQQLQPSDQITLISFARTPRLLADRVSGEGIKDLVQLIENLPSDGGTNIEAALQLAWEKAREQWTEGAQNRIILLTDGAVNLGDANPERLSDLVTTIRESGIAFDAAGISANGLNDEVLEALTRKGDGRYYLLDSAESAEDGFARQIAGALRPSAMNVKVQVEFNPQRVGHYRLLGFEKHRLNKEDFRDDQVDAAEMAAAEAGVAVYQFEPKPDGEGDVGSVSVRFRNVSTGQMVERRWPILYQPSPPRIEQSSASMRLAAAAAMFAAKLGGGPLGEAVDLKTLAELLAGLPPQNRTAMRVQQLEQMIQQARQISGG